MRQYLDLLQKILDHGNDRGDRTGTGTRSLFGEQLRFDLRKGFPILTTKKLHWKSIAGELVWLLSGSTNVRDLQKDGITIWDEWADENGELGPVYGKQWRQWNEGDVGPAFAIDQISDVIKSLRANPEGRRHIVTAWNPSQVDQMKLPPCHLLFQFYVTTFRHYQDPSIVIGSDLSCHMYQRSADVFLGVPFNIASYALLTHLIAREVGMGVGELIISFGDVHIYNNHFDQVREQLSRTPRELPELSIQASVRSIFDYTWDCFALLGYDPYPAIKAPVAV